MDTVSLLVNLVFKTFFLALPVGVAWLAFRRLSMSESANAWLYSAVGIFASVAALAFAPWALGFSSISWITLVAVAACPPLWIATVLACDLRERSYGDERTATWVGEKFRSTRHARAPKPPQSPLILMNPVVPEQSTSMFRTSRTESTEPEIIAKPVARLVREPATVQPAGRVELPDAPRRVLDVARDMRGSLSDRQTLETA